MYAPNHYNSNIAIIKCLLLLFKILFIEITLKLGTVYVHIYSLLVRATFTAFIACLLGARLRKHLLYR